MNETKPRWYNQLNANEKRIIDFFAKESGFHLTSRPVLEDRFCKTKLMNQKTLTTRLNYLAFEKRILGRLKGKKGARFYAPYFIAELARSNPMTMANIDRQPPKARLAITLPIKVVCERISAEKTCELLIRSAETWERVGVGSDAEKQKVYDELRKIRKRIVRKWRDEHPDEVS